jgi:hypothetical protein
MIQEYLLAKKTGFWPGWHSQQAFHTRKPGVLHHHQWH